MTPFGFSSIGPESRGPEVPNEKTSEVDQSGVLGAHGQDDDLWNLTGSNYLRDAAWADQAWQ
ncbi:hypothetical protein ACMX2H_11255 [Arthrobacter sulfonylureivorans]|uniref:hypothetical protein n=1 Tax=Arthrobacter sulfonylureivorans TaxID=2486855 RepID=UPI0039E72B42